MQSSTPPIRIPVAFAEAGARNTIPVNSQVAVTPGAASLIDGFPPLTRQPLVSGGVAPFGEDFNGILHLISDNIRWLNAGGPAFYDAAYCALIGGYPKQAIVASSATPGICWMSTIDANANNPDTGGAGWVRAAGSQGYVHVSAFGTPGVTSWTAPAGDTQALALVLGGGGGGANCKSASGSMSGSTFGGGGGSGGGALAYFYIPAAGLTLPVVVAPGGGAQIAGGTSSLGSLATATGGGASAFQSPGGNPTFSAGGVPGTGYLGANIQGIAWQGGHGSDGQAGTYAFAGNGAASMFGSGGRAAAAAGVTAVAPGSGGGGAYDPALSGNQYYGGAGATGLVLILSWGGVD